MESVAERIGANVRRLRRQRGLTLAELGRSTQLAKGTLAAIEQGRGNPTIETLYSLTRGLKATMGDLVAETAPSVTKVVRRKEAPLLPGENLEARLLSRSGGGGIVVELYSLYLGAGANQSSPGHAAGVREELLITSGRFRAGPEDDLAELDAGDYASYSADAPHRYEAIGDDPAAGVLLMRFPAPSAHTDVLGGEIVGADDGD